MNRRFAVILGLLTTSCFASAFVACGSSSSGKGEDAGADHTSADSAAPDSSTGTDSSSTDSTASDTGSGGEGGEDEGGDDASDGGTCTIYDASALDDASVQAGFLEVWQVYKCWRCHQNASDRVDDAGKGILLNGNTEGLAGSKTIFPPNLTNSAQGLGCWSDPEIEKAILKGRDPEGGALCAPMPVFGDGTGTGRPMDAGTAQEIIDYLRSLKPSSQTTPDTTCSPEDGGSDGESDAPHDAPDGE